MNRKNLTIVACLFLLTACAKKTSSKQDAPQPGPPAINPPATSSVDVMVVGNAESTNSKAALWTNTIQTLLAPHPSIANNVTIRSTDVYIAGSNYLNVPTGACYWKNNVLVQLPGGTSYSEATAIALQGSDVYASGRNLLPGSISKAVYWKNTVMIPLPVNTDLSYANDIYLQNSDVYICGAYGIPRRACYWKNGSFISLDNAGFESEAKSIIISGSDVYVAGYIRQSGTTRNAAAIWKNGVITKLTNGEYNASANDVAIGGSDVYICGEEISSTWPNWITGKYWKNGAVTTLSGGATSARSIAVNGNDIYIAGTYSDPAVASYNVRAAFWKNGEITRLSEGTAGIPSGIALLFK